MKKHATAPRHIWTKEEIVKIIKLWESETPESLAEEMGLSAYQVLYMANLIRKKGLKLIKKRKNGITSFLVEEVIKDLRK